MNPKPIRPTPAPTVHVACQDYEQHRFRHVQEGHGFRCPICSPTTTPSPEDRAARASGLAERAATPKETK